MRKFENEKITYGVFNQYIDELVPYAFRGDLFMCICQQS